jgi:putative oxidoreductase
MLYHGIEKLRAPEQAAQAFGGLGFRRPGFWARATGIAETAAGALSLFGFLVRPAALAVLVTQGTAIAKVHAPKGYSAHKGGFEFNLALMAIATALLIGGPGRYSGSGLLSRAVGGRPRRFGLPRRRRGVVAALATLLEALG